MPDHLHALITPLTSLEKSVQFIKGGFSYRAKKELGSNMEVWQKGFQDHRIRDASDYAVHVSCIRNNPVKEGLCERPDKYPYSSAYPGFELDAVPQGLKPQSVYNSDGAAEAAPFQNETASGTTRLEGVPFQDKTVNQMEISSDEAAPTQNRIDPSTPGTEGVRIQNRSADQVQTNADGVPFLDKVTNRSKAALEKQRFERVRLQAHRKGA
jgi:hypothetical protein